MLSSRGRNASIVTAFIFLALAATGLAQIHPGSGTSLHPPVTVPIASSHPITLPPTMAPVNSMGPLGKYTGAVAPGAKVPLYRLPKLPPRTAFNTILPRETFHGKHYRPFGATVHNVGFSKMHPHAASGATIEFWATSVACTSSGTVGALYNVGCGVEWEPVNLDNNNATDTYQTYYIASNATAATSVASGTPLAANNGSLAAVTTTLSSGGTWTFGVYDVTTQQWVAVAYANAGNTFNIGVYQDAFHLTQSSQFDVSSSPAAYIYLTGLAPADYYVVYVTRTGDSPSCVFISPNTSPTPIPGPTPTGTATGLICNPSNSTGNQAPNGNLAITWPLSATYHAGTYSIAVYDCSTVCNSGTASGELLGQTQVSLTGSGGVTIIISPNGANANPSPNPQPAATANTIFDWDGTTDQSDSGVSGLAGQSNPLTSGHLYTWTLTDPQGQVVAIATPTALPSGTTSQTQTFQFASANLGFNQATAPNLPGTYPSNNWSMQVYDRTSKNVIAAQSFKMLGYASQTQFIYPSVTGNPGNAIAISTGSTTVADLRITNTSSTIYPNAGDSFSEMIFSTGPDFNATNTGNGIVATLNGCAAATCSGTATDSNGNTWNVNTNCSSTTSNNAECNVLLTPGTTGVTLTPGSYVTVTAMSWKNTHGASGCGTACQGITAELPLNGLTWSVAPSVTVAWTPVYFSISPSDSGTSSFRIVGSIDCGTGTRHLATPPPFVGTHCYQDRFAQADYQNNTPFSVTNANQSIWAFTITNAAGSANAISELEFQQPSLLYTQGGIKAVDTLSSANWQNTACPSGYGGQWYCITGKAGHTIAAGGNEIIYLDANWPNQSFAYTDFAVLATQTPTVSDVFALPAATGTNTTIDGQYTTLDNLAVGAYSLNGGLMSSYFSPTSVGTNQTTTPLSIVITNTSTTQDANPDSIDALIIEQSTNKNWTISGTPTVSKTGWSNIGTNNPSGNTLDYWYGLCAGQYVTTSGPPATNPTTVQNAVPECTTPESNSLAAGQSMTINMNVLNFGSPSSPITFTLYAHGANGGGWSTAKTFSLLTASETASVAITQIGSNTFSNPTVPYVGSGPNTYTYQIKNTSASADINNIVITLPGQDINGNNATDSSGNTWTLVSPISSTITLSGAPASSCTVNTSPTATFSASTSGANGQITVNCTGAAFAPGTTLNVLFQANNPQSQSDTYTFPATLDGSSTGVGASYLGADQVQVSFSIGLSVAVDPSNPGPGSSHPIPACAPAQCNFSGTTLDFGSIANKATVVGTDVVLASVVYGGNTSANTWTLSVSTNSNPACTTGGGYTCPGADEMLMKDDTTASRQGVALTCWTPAASNFNVTSFAIVPVGSGTQIANGPETKCGTAYDIVQDYEIGVGTEAITGVTATVTYTLIAN